MPVISYLFLENLNITDCDGQSTAGKYTQQKKTINLYLMPTLLLLNGIRFFFYSNEDDEPAHVHVEKAQASGKIWLDPEVKTAFLNGFINSEARLISDIIMANCEHFKQKWNEYFNQ